MIALNGKMTPTQIYKILKENDKHITLNNVCTLLSLLKKQSIVICINKEQKKGRLYILTTAGKLIKEQMQAIGIQ